MRIIDQAVLKVLAERRDSNTAERTNTAEESGPTDEPKEERRGRLYPTAIWEDMVKSSRNDDFQLWNELDR